LRFGGLKLVKGDHFDRLLGTDTRWTKIDRLVSNEKWGAYFQKEFMDADDSVVSELERGVEDVRSWLQGDSWKSSSTSSN
jgi:hypothetical protein